MTHFVGAVVTPAGLSEADLKVHLGEVLAKFDEDRTVDPYVSATKQQQIDHMRGWLAIAADALVKYRAGEPPYDPSSGPAPAVHVRWITTEAPALAALDDEALWDYLVTNEPVKRDENGAIWSTYNPNAKWDWWVVGGRWEDVYRARQGRPVGSVLAKLRQMKDVLARGDELASGSWWPGNLLTSDQQWHEIGLTGLFGMHEDAMSEREWVDHCLEALGREDPSAVVYYIDFHI